MNGKTLDAITLPDKPSDTAPDGSEIRLLRTMHGGGVCHCTLQQGRTSFAVRHKTVEEIWYILSGEGEIWRMFEEEEEFTSLRPGVALTIPPHTNFQFRNSSLEPLCILITTTPPWPGPEEALTAIGPW